MWIRWERMLSSVLFLYNGNMLLKISQIKCPIGQELSKEMIARKISTQVDNISSFEIVRESLDARKDNLVYSYTVKAQVKNGHKFLKNKDVIETTDEKYINPKPIHTDKRPIIVGFGPSGMFAGLLLAECGLKPIIIERGKPVEEREKDINAFFQDGLLQKESNIQYGEGGAGTFSDGKLTTRMKNIRVSKVLDEFVEAGANKEITYQQRPHIGTDVLRTIVKNIREKIISLGGEIYFNTRLESLEIHNCRVKKVITNQGTFESEYVLLCCGHSASDTYETLYQQGVNMIQKDFACGVRVEHPQNLINQNQYGDYADHPSLSAASYSLTYRSSLQRGVYSFCMCPGGVVVPASTESNALAVNGMSYSARDGRNANSAILVQIPTKDFDHGHPLDGFAFQKQLEQKAYIDLFNAPSENIKDYVEHKTPSSLCIASSFPRENVVSDMHKLFSDDVNQSLEEGFINFNHKIPGFIDQGIMVGMESRSSSPIRITRNEDGESINVHGLYPCGEGAGYAGGIISSAVDGIKQAENVIEHIKKQIL